VRWQITPLAYSFVAARSVRAFIIELVARHSGRRLYVSPSGRENEGWYELDRSGRAPYVPPDLAASRRVSTRSSPRERQMVCR
jgi:hypothetical protein